MLVLQRGLNEAIELDGLGVWVKGAWHPIDPVTIRIVQFKKGSVRIGIEAHKAVAIHRPETRGQGRKAA